MRRILFVDDEPNILDGLRRLLHRHRDVWDMEFACGGEAAVVALEARPFDVIVTDMRMPGMSGSALLMRVRDLFPDMVRIVLSGHTEFETAIRSVALAQQFLTKPCDADQIREVIERACELRALLKNKTLREIVGKLESLPTGLRTYRELAAALDAPNVSTADVAAILERDSGMCVKILQVVNSGYFGLSRKISSIPLAVSYLGCTIVRNLVLSIEATHALEANVKTAGYSLDAHRLHALTVASIARRMFDEEHLAQSAFMAANLHDVGKLVLASCAPDHSAKIISRVRATGDPMHAVEQETFGSTHAEIGAYLLGLWGLPYGLVEAVAFHHAPGSVAHAAFDVVDAVYLANLLAHEHVAAGSGLPGGRHEAIDLPYLESLGVGGQLAAWRAMAAKQAESPAEV